MEEPKNILQNLFDNAPTFVSNINCYNRNLILVYSIKGKKVLFKEFKEKEFAEREKFFYRILKDSCKIPRVYAKGDDFIIMEYIESSTPNVLMTVEDWARIHSRFLEDQILEHPLMFNYKSRNLSDYVLSHRKMFEEITEKLAEVLSNKERQGKYSTLIHGDLFGRNILTNNGTNYYIDFELSGRGHPTKDLSLLLLNHPSMEDEIIETYRRNISFDYEGIEEDITRDLLSKGTQLILGLRNLKMPSEGKKRIHKKFLSVLRTHIE